MIGSGDTFADVLGSFTGLFDAVITLLLALIVFFLFWRIFTTWFIGGGDPAEIEKGKQSVMVGLVVLVAVFGLWGIVLIIRATFFGT